MSVEGATPYAYLSLLEQPKRKRFPYAVAFSLLAVLFATACFVWCIAAQAHASTQSQRMAPGPALAALPKTSVAPRGVLAWQAFGRANGSAALNPFNQWISYSQYDPAAGSAVAIRATGPVIQPGQYSYEYSAQLTISCAGATGVPCNSTAVNGLFACPRMSMYLSCVNDSAGDGVVQPNDCSAGRSPPAGYAYCVVPVSDRANYGLSYRFTDILLPASQNSLQTTWSNLNANTEYVDISSRSNCSLVVNWGDSCQPRFAPPYNVLLTNFYINMYTLVPQPVQIMY